ncbi:MAG: hypothetical protein KHZ86_04440 [Firmicutes bacterium]|nr:hypothetical protein [Bacillota bacterium]
MAGYYNPKKDYAAAIKAEKNPAKQAQLKAERQNKIDAMNAAGTNTKGYTNSIYGGSYSSSGKGNSSSGGDGKGNSSGGYFDKNLDYAAAIRNEKDPVKQAKLIAERQNKLNWMNASGTNTKGYTNDIYGGMPQASAPQGQYRSTDAALNNTNKAAIQPTATTQTQTATAAEAENPTAPTSFGSTDAAQRAALQAYITRQYAHQKAESGEGTYNGDGSMSLPDQGLLKSYQQKYNEAKAAGDQGGMTAAHSAAEKLRDNYRYYPLAHSNGYGLGENDIGWVRDLVVRGDELGNKIVDQYNRGTFTQTTYDKDGNFVNRYTGGDIAGHDARVAKEMQRVNEKLAGKENNTFAFRLSDPNDVKLSNAELLAKYGGGITEGNNGIGLYTAPNGMAMKTASGGGNNGMAASGTPLTAAGYGGQAGYGTGQDAAANSIYGQFGYFDPNKDYAAAIKNASNTQEMVQLEKERQNKLNWMNANGTNKGYTNQIYSNYDNLFGEREPLPEYNGMTKEELFGGYNEMAESLAEQRKALLSAALAQNRTEQEKANGNYDELARQAYILKRQNENALPQQLAALGISGGSSESANLALAANYENSLASNEQARQQALRDYALQALQARTQADSDISGYYADAKQQAMNAWQSEAANRNSWNQWAANYKQGLREYSDSMNSQTYQENLASKQYADTLRQQQIDLALQMGDYKKLAAMGYDVSYLKRMQDAELEQLALDAMLTRANIAKVNSSVTRGSGGGTRSSKGGKGGSKGGGNGGSSSSGTGKGTTDVSAAGLMKLQNLVNYYGTKSNPLVNTAIQNMLKNGTINEATYNAFLKTMK